jgi:hypothetical protein
MKTVIKNLIDLLIFRQPRDIMDLVFGFGLWVVILIIFFT